MSLTKREWKHNGYIHAGTHFVVHGLSAERQQQQSQHLAADVGTNPLLNSTNNSENAPNFVVEGLATIEREVILCIHGIKAYNTCFNRLIEDLLKAHPDRYVIIAYDQMGRGFSQPSTNNQYTEKEYLSQLTTLVDHLFDDFLPSRKVVVQSKKLTVIGHSMGGALSSIFAAQHPDLVERLILLSPAGIISSMSPFGFIRGCKCLASKMKVNMQRPENQLKSWKADFFHQLEDSSTSEYFKEVIKESIDDLDLMYSSNGTAFESFWLTLTQFPLLNITSNYLTKLRSGQGRTSPLPILLLWGRDDSSISAKNSYPKWVNYFETLQKSGHFSSKLYPQAKHGFFIEYHEDVAKDISNFLSKDFH